MTRKPGSATPIGRVLLERRVASVAALAEAVRAALASDERLCSTLLRSGACDEGELVAALAERLGGRGVDLSRTVVDLATVDLLPRGIAESELLLPLAVEEGRLHVAVESPERARRALEEVRFITGREIVPYVAVRSALRAAIAGCYDGRARRATSWRGSAATAIGPTLAERSGERAAPPAPPPPGGANVPATEWIARGRAALGAGRLEEAWSAYQAALAAVPSSAEAHLGVGEVLRLRGDAFGAIRALEHALELDPDLLDAVPVLAALYVQKGFRARAAEALDRAAAATSDPVRREALRRERMRLR